SEGVTTVPCPIRSEPTRTAPHRGPRRRAYGDCGGTNGGYRTFGAVRDHVGSASPAACSDHGAPNDVMTTQNGRAFNEWLRAQLKAKKMSQRQLAQQSGVDHSTISRLIRGDRMPSLGTATKLARGLRELRDDADTPQYLAVRMRRYGRTFQASDSVSHNERTADRIVRSSAPGAPVGVGIGNGTTLG